MEESNIANPQIPEMPEKPNKILIGAVIVMAIICFGFILQFGMAKTVWKSQPTSTLTSAPTSTPAFVTQKQNLVQCLTMFAQNVQGGICFQKVDMINWCIDQSIK
jgi:flagellar motor component MotA